MLGFSRFCFSTSDAHTWACGPCHGEIPRRYRQPTTYPIFKNFNVAFFLKNWVELVFSIKARIGFKIKNFINFLFRSACSLISSTWADSNSNGFQCGLGGLFYKRCKKVLGSYNQAVSCSLLQRCQPEGAHKHLTNTQKCCYNILVKW